MPDYFCSRSRHCGFTLVEAIIVIVVTGIIAGMVAVFIRAPIDSYFDAARRAELTDTADTAVRRLARDVRLALPNSLRNPSDGSDQCIEFIPTKTGARYRALPEAGGNGDPLDFLAVDNAFDMLWLNSTEPVNTRIVSGDIVVVYNDGNPASGDAYSGINAIQIASLAEPGGTANTTAITFVGTAAAIPFNRKQLPSESPANRFQVIPKNEHVVAYRCNAGVLTRSSRKLTAAWGQPTSCAAMTAGATTARLANNALSCSFRYDPPGASTSLSRYGILSITLQLGDANENVKLYHQVHVENTP